MAGPVKLALTVGFISAIGASFLSNNAPRAPEAPARAGAPAAPAKAGWFSSWFEGMEINRGPARPVPAVATAPGPTATGVGYGRIEIRPDTGGQYHADVEIDGRTIPMLVDTGATLITFSADDADRLGLRPTPSDFRVEVQTANGVMTAARVTLNEVRVGTLAVRGVEAIVLKRGVVAKSLLGMSFLRKLGGFEIAGGNLVLRQ